MVTSYAACGVVTRMEDTVIRWYRRGDVRCQFSVVSNGERKYESGEKGSGSTDWRSSSGSFDSPSTSSGSLRMTASWDGVWFGWC